MEDHPGHLEVASGKEERVELSFGRENVLQPRNVLDILPPFAKKPVSRSLDDVVSESRRGEESEMFTANTSYESEAVSDSEEVFPHRCMPGLSLNLAGAQSEDTEASFGPDEQAVVTCLDDVLSEHDRRLSGQASAEQPLYQMSSVREELTEHDGSNVAELPNTVWKSSTESRVGGQIAQNLSSQSEVAFPVSTPNVLVEPPTPAVSGFRYGDFHGVGELPFIDESGDLSKKPEMVIAHPALCKTNLPADYSLASSEKVAKLKEPDSESLMQNTPASFPLKRDVAENESWKVASGVVDTDQVATVKDRSCVDVTGEEHHEVMSTADRFMHRVSDTERSDSGTTKETECREVASIMSYKDRHEVSSSDCERSVSAEKEVGTTLGTSSGRDRSKSDVVMVGELQEIGVVGAKQRNDVFSVRPYKDRQEVIVRVDCDESRDSKSYDHRTYGFLGKPDDFENKRDDFKQKMGDTSSSFMASTKPVAFDATGSTFERPMKPVGFVPFSATPAGNGSTSVPPSESVRMTSAGTNSSFVATSVQVGSTSTETSSSFMTPTKPVRADVIPAGTDSASVALTKSVGVTSVGTGSSLVTPSNPTNTSVTSSAPTKLTDHSEMVQSLKLFFLSGSLNPDQSPTATPRGRSNSDLNLFRPPAVATTLSKSDQTRDNNSDDTRYGSSASFSIGSQSNVDTSSRIAPTTTHYSSSTDIRSNAVSSKENYSASLVESSSQHQSSQSSAVEGATRIARPGMPPPPPVRRNRPSDSSTTSATARRSTEDTSKIVIEDTRL